MGITADTKDWTWVLVRPCPECGFDASTQSKKDLPATIRASTDAWQRVLSRSDVRIRKSDDRWSDLEYGCHVRDVFKIFDERLQHMLSEDDPTFANWDQDLTAVEDRYDSQDPQTVSKQLADAAATIAGRFESVGEQEWDRPGTRSNGSHFTVESLGIYLVHDPLHHLWDVSAAPGGTYQ